MPAALSVDKSLTQARQAAKKQDWLTAVGLYKSVLSRFPGNKKAAKAVAELRVGATQALLQMAKTARDSEDWRALNQCLEAAVFLAPDVLEIKSALAEGYIQAGHAAAALPILEKLLKVRAEDSALYALYGEALHELDRPDDARTALEKAVEVSPKNLKALRNLAVVERSQGNLEAAQKYYETALEFAPNDALLLRSLSLLTKPESENDATLTKMRSALAALGQDNVKAAPIHFALFEVLHRRKDYKAAFPHLVKGNALQAQKRPFDFNSEAVVAGFSKAQFADPISPVAEGAETRLIFVTGLPRTGTTLAERILSRSPDVQACGELMIVQRAVIDLLGEVRRRNNIKIKPSDIAGLRDRLLGEFDKISDGRLVQVDKMPLNFRWIGYICASLPEARIVHMQRDPMAVAWSLYRHVFRGNGHDFMHTYEDIARFMILHRDLMSHWRNVCGDRVFDLDYSDLVNDQEGATKRLAQATEREWSADWLSPEKATNHVRTASVLQVTKPIYKNSDEAWRTYETQLAPLQKALATAGLI